MKSYHYLLTASLLLAATRMPAMAQSVRFADDDLDRGYTSRPYLRYEAEEGRVAGASGLEYISAADYTQDNPACEASNLEAALLSGPGSYVEWTLDADANALTVRFSLPDSDNGEGTRQKVAIKCGGETLGEIELDSYWAWQYTVRANVSEKYPDNTPSPAKFARMRFDEASLLLSATVPGGSRLRLERLSDSPDPLTIDFIEAEMAEAPLTFGDIPGTEGVEKVEFAGEGQKLQAFINANGGKTIFLPAGRYDIPTGLEIRSDGTRLVGAGMWHTTLHFTASSDNPRTYGRRGITCSRSGCAVTDLSLTTVNNKRYYNNNPACQTGKGLMGSWGKGSRWERIRVDHFECGAWVADYNGNSTDGLEVTDCRFRNNYADGINLCSGSAYCTVSRCSFRNNGDDDMASWSTGNMTHDNLFDHNTAENNWRASSLGLFGGRNQKATNIAIYDAMENGLRVNADFPGTGFAADGEILLQDISLRRCGTRMGTCGTLGDFWGNAQAAVSISAGYHYDVNNVTLSDIDLFDCRFEGFRIKSGSGKRVTGLTMRRLSVTRQGDDGWAYHFLNGLKGNGTGEDLTACECAEPFISPIPEGFSFNITGAVETPAEDRTPASLIQEGRVCGASCMYSADGRPLATLRAGDRIPPLTSGIYLLAAPGLPAVKIAVR